MRQIKHLSRPRPVIYLLKHVQSELRNALEDALAPAGLTASQMAVLSALSTEPGLSNADLARVTFVTPQTMVPLLSSLEGRGLLVRHAHPSGGRAMPARLTTQGVALLKTSWKAVQTVEEQMLHGLAAKEQARLRELLEHCLAALRPEDSKTKEGSTVTRKMTEFRMGKAARSPSSR
jgi:DNA-binding MarR family transcriptional regulator